MNPDTDTPKNSWPLGRFGLPVAIVCLVTLMATIGNGQIPAPSVPAPAPATAATPPSASPTGLGLDDRIVLENVKINDQAVTIAFDSGTEIFALFSPAAKRLGLKITEPGADEKPRQGEVAAGKTDPVKFQYGTDTKTTAISVIDWPEALSDDVDGVLGWGSLEGNFLLTLPAGSHKLTIAPANEATLVAELKLLGVGSLDLKVAPLDLWGGPVDKAPDPAQAFQQLRIRKDSRILVLDLPAQTGPPGGILIDTGDDGGVSLAPAKWRDWRAAHPTAPITMDAAYFPAAGIVVREVAWAKELTVGPLTLTNVTVQEAELSAMPDIAGYAATLGLAALDRQDVIIDGKNGVVYFARQTAPVKSIQHNRLGAAFAPRDMQHDDLVAHVAAGSPAEMAGIRNGDLLLKIDAIDYTKWRTDPSLSNGHKLEQPAGTTVNLTLKRGEKEFTARVTLRDILGPGLDSTAKPSPVSPQPGKP
jgi:hypothetical protein